MAHNQSQEKLSIILTVIGTILFSSKVLLAKWAYLHGASPLTVLMLRMASAAPFYIIIGIIASQRSKVPITKKEWLTLLFLGIIGYYLSSFMDFTGMQYISSGLERMILYLYPTFVFIISVGILKQKITRRVLVALIISYSGILCMFFGDVNFDNSDQLFGSFLIVAAAFTFAIFLVVGGKLIKKIGSIRFTSYAMLTSAVSLVTHFSIASPIGFAEISTDVLLIGSAIGAGCTVLPSFMINKGLAELGPERVSIYGAVGPVTVLVLGSVVYDEPFTALKIVGAILVILGGVTLSIKGFKRK
ncbi:MAG: DMT family transporter [Fibrobacterales bacterium]